MFVSSYVYVYVCMYIVCECVCTWGWVGVGGGISLFLHDVALKHTCNVILQNKKSCAKKREARCRSKTLMMMPL